MSLSQNIPHPNVRTFPLPSDHAINEDACPSAMTAILKAHTDEVWNVEWSRSGIFLATASKDRSAIIWRKESDTDPMTREYTPVHNLRDHPYSVDCMAWSSDDSILLTASAHYIKMWNTRTGICLHVLDDHSDVVTALEWLPDGLGFISGSLDSRIIIWDTDGKQRDSWGRTPIRILDIATTPDCTRLIAIGMYDARTILSAGNGTPQDEIGTPAAVAPSRSFERRVIVYNISSKQIERSLRLDGDLTSVKTSQDTPYALISRSPPESSATCEIQLYDWKNEKFIRKYTGHKQSLHVIRSCFGGVESKFIASGSEDGNVYVWNRDTGELLKVLSGHGTGSVNSVAWNPKNERILASCSDDHTVRIWEAPPPTALPSTNPNEAALELESSATL